VTSEEPEHEISGGVSTPTATSNPSASGFLFYHWQTFRQKATGSQQSVEAVRQRRNPRLWFRSEVDWQRPGMINNACRGQLRKRRKNFSLALFISSMKQGNRLDIGRSDSVASTQYASTSKIPASSHIPRLPTRLTHAVNLNRYADTSHWPVVVDSIIYHTGKRAHFPSHQADYLQTTALALIKFIPSLPHFLVLSPANQTR